MIPSKFIIEKEFSHEHMGKSLKNLHEAYDAVLGGIRSHEGSVPASQLDIAAFCEALVNSQRPELEPWIPDGNWCLVPNPREQGLPSDAMDEYLDHPTFYAVGILVYTAANLSDVFAAVPGGMNAIRRALGFLERRGFHGSGYDTENTIAKSIDILAKAGVFHYIGQHAAEYPNLVKRLGIYIESYEARLAADEVHGSWGENFRPDIEASLKKLAPIRQSVKKSIKKTIKKTTVKAPITSTTPKTPKS